MIESTACCIGPGMLPGRISNASERATLNSLGALA